MTEPAFPVTELDQQTGSVHAQHLGMTLRDYFAGQALLALTNTVLLSEVQALADGIRGGRIVAKACYTLADAMLVARKKDPADGK